MTNLNLKGALAAVTLALSLLTPAAQAQAHKVTLPVPTVALVIAAQGDAALRLIRTEMKAAIRLVKPELPAAAQVHKVAAPAARSAPATAALAE
jgi:hypothetical protein